MLQFHIVLLETQQITEVFVVKRKVVGNEKNTIYIPYRQNNLIHPFTWILITKFMIFFLNFAVLKK